jgi:hypothetical protein
MKIKHFFSIFLCLIAATLNAQITITPRGVSGNTFSSITTAQDSYFNTIRVGTGVGNNPFNVVVGTNFTLAANNSDAGGNVAISHGALQRNTSGVSNLSVGVISSNFNTTGSYNTIFGSAAFYFNTTGSFNTAIGRWALYNSRGNRNIALGNNAGYSITNGSNNVLIGGNNGSRIANRSNVMLFSDGLGNERFAVDSLGNMSIATTQAPDRLNVRGRIYSFGPTGGLRLGDRTDTTRIWTLSSYNTQKLTIDKNFGGGSSSPLVIDGTTGFVGLNQPSPTAQLDVLGNGRFFGGSLTVTPFFGVGGAVNFRSSSSTSDFSNFFNSWTGFGAARKLRFSYQHKNPEDAFAAENAVMEIQGSNLEFLGNTRFPNSLTIPLNAAAGRLLQSDGSGNASWWTPNYGVLGSSNIWSASNTFSGGVTTNQISINGTAGAGFVSFVPQSSNPAAPASGFRQFANSSGLFSWIGSNGFVRTFDASSITGNVTWIMPNSSGSVPLLSTSNTWTSSNTFQQGVNLATVAGNVGIGTALPNVRTEIAGSENNVSLRVTSNNAGASSLNYSEIQLADNGSVRTYWRNLRDGSGATIFSYNDHIRFLAGETERLRITNAGNVGMGLNNPQDRLSVVGAIRSTNDASAVGFYTTGGYRHTGQNGVWLDFNTGGASSFVQFRNGSGYTDVMRIDANNNIGIGTTAPASNTILDINSTTRAVRIPRMTTTEINAISSPSAGMVVYNTTLQKLCYHNGTGWRQVTDTAM